MEGLKATGHLARYLEASRESANGAVARLCPGASRPTLPIAGQSVWVPCGLDDGSWLTVSLLTNITC